jgi:hypothetical protein
MEGKDHLLTWRKSRASAANGDCVEVAFGQDGRATGMVRDSKRPQAGHLAVKLDAFEAFLADAKSGRYDLAGLDTDGGVGLRPGPFCPRGECLTRQAVTSWPLLTSGADGR